jgi:2,4-dienoyl-CoA reductase-like NADH-dependent reductase (Old Yellow Enzyme family)
MSVDVLFEEVDFGRLRLRNRLALTATGLGAYGEDVERYRDNIAGYVEARARGGVGMMLLPSMGIARLDRFAPDDPAAEAWYASHVETMAGFTAVAREVGVPIGIQLLHRGAQAPMSGPRWAPSDVGWSARLEPPTPLSDEEAIAIAERHALAARLAVEAGFDFVELHAGHGYLLHEFMSPRFNHRTTGAYAGPDGGVHYATQVLDAVRDAVGREFPISLRISGREGTEPGVQLDAMLEIAPKLASYVDLVNVSFGSYGSFPVIVAPYSVPFGYNKELARAVRAVVDVPVLSAGRVWEPSDMADLVESGAADIVGLGRALWADPDLPRKLRAGDFDDVRPAIGCNQGCIDRTDGRVRTCLVNPFWGRERELLVTPAPVRRRVTVVGGGPAGLEAARIAAQRGHDVTLVEATASLGGRFRLAAQTPGKAEFGRFTRWQARQVLHGEVSVELGTPIDASVLTRLAPDVLVMATGAVPTARRLDGVRTVSPEEALERPWSVGARVLVVGGDQGHLEAALSFAVLGRSVTVISEGRPGTELGATRRYHLMEQLRSSGVQLERRPVGQPVVLPDGPFDTVIAGALDPSRSGLEPMLAGLDAEVHWLGDADRIGNALDAVAAAVALALEL